MFAVTGKRLATLRKRVQDRNRRFRAKSVEEQRMIIAQDVIDQLKAKKLKARAGHCYLDVNRQNAKAMNKPEAAELDLSLVTSQIDCTVCGIGGVFIAALERNDQLKVGKFKWFGMMDGNPEEDKELDRRHMVKYLKPWFDAGQLTKIEQYFEQNPAGNRSPIKQEGDDRKRLIMIMENILSNGGKFAPSKGAHAHEQTKHSNWY